MRGHKSQDNIKGIQFKIILRKKEVDPQVLPDTKHLILNFDFKGTHFLFMLLVPFT